jgi:hypothetical protein
VNIEIITTAITCVALRLLASSVSAERVNCHTRRNIATLFYSRGVSL